MNALRPLVIALAIISPLASVALAGHTEPAKAKKAKFELVNAYLECSSANTSTLSNGASACAPAVPAFSCALGPGGSGKLSATLTGNLDTGTQDIKFGASANGLTCEGSTLCIAVSLRATTDDCPEGSCTITDLIDLPLDVAPGSCCLVTDGKCRIKTTLLTALPGWFSNGKNTGIELLRCGLVQQPPGGPHPPALSCGILLK